MATSSSSHNEAEENIRNELQSITDEYDHPFTPKQVETLAKFISVDYDDRRIRIKGDIVSRYFDNTPQFLALGYLNQMLEKLSKNTPLSMVKNHVEIFSFLIRELKGYFVGAVWLHKLENLVRDNQTYARELEATEKQLKEIFNDRLESIREEKEQLLGELQVKKAQLYCSEEENISDQVFAEYLQNSEMIKGVFEKEIKQVQATIDEIRSDVKPNLTAGAIEKLNSLEFDIFSPSIIREKGTRSTSAYDKIDWLEGTSNRSQERSTSASDKIDCLEGTSIRSQESSTSAYDKIDWSEGTSNRNQERSTSASDKIDCLEGTSIRSQERSKSINDQIDWLKDTSNGSQEWQKKWN